MRPVYVLVEAADDAAFLRRILPQEALSGVQLVDASGSSGIPSLARTLLVRRRCPVAVVMDSGSVNPEVTDERRESTEELIRAAAATTPVKVVAAVPEIEAWLLAAPESIERYFGEKVSEEWLALAKGDPRGALRWFAKKHHKRWDMNQAVAALDIHDIELIRAVPEVAELTVFLQEMQNNGQHNGGRASSVHGGAKKGV
jgi:hypothetical protein